MYDQVCNKFEDIYDKFCARYLILKAGPLGLMGREPDHQTSEPGSNPSWDATVHPVCETFNVMHVV